MTQKISQENAVEVVDHILTEYYRLNSEPFLSVLAKDCLWIHPGKFIVMGAEAIQKVCEDGFGIPAFQIEDKEFTLLDTKSPEQIAVYGSYFIFSDVKSEMILSEKQRVTFLFRKEKDDFRLYHLHTSNECIGLDEDEFFPVQISRQTYHYVQKILKDNASSYKCHITCRIAVETNSTTQCIDPDMVQYVEAMGKVCVVYMLDRSMVIHKPISELEKILPKCFYRIHRSYLVNCNYVIQLDRYVVRLLSGAVLPVPAKRYGEIREAVSALMKKQ